MFLSTHPLMVGWNGNGGVNLYKPNEMMPRNWMGWRLIFVPERSNKDRSFKSSGWFQKWCKPWRVELKKTCYRIFFTKILLGLFVVLMKQWQRSRQCWPSKSEHPTFVLGKLVAPRLGWGHWPRPVPGLPTTPPCRTCSRSQPTSPDLGDWGCFRVSLGCSIKII